MFPGKELEDWVIRIKPEPSMMDWDKELEEVQDKMLETFVDVEFTLLSQRYFKNWPHNKMISSGIVSSPDEEVEYATGVTDVVFAEGNGKLFLEDGKELFFSWRVPYKYHLSDKLGAGESFCSFFDVDRHQLERKTDQVLHWEDQSNAIPNLGGIKYSQNYHLHYRYPSNI